jgi:structural maintenance of chromosome 3 (chondroitin sulfate proteoglycan 6)
VEEGNVLSQRKERLNERVEKLETEIQELETEITGLQAKTEAYTAEMQTPMANALTREEEGQIVSFGKEVERRKKDILELSKTKNEVHSNSPRSLLLLMIGRDSLKVVRIPWKSS